MIQIIPRYKRLDYCLDHYHICDTCRLESCPESCAYYSADECVDLPCAYCQDMVDAGENEPEEEY